MNNNFLQTKKFSENNGIVLLFLQISLMSRFSHLVLHSVCYDILSWLKDLEKIWPHTDLLLGSSWEPQRTYTWRATGSHNWVGRLMVVPKPTCCREQNNLFNFFPRVVKVGMERTRSFLNVFDLRCLSGFKIRVYSSGSWKSGFGCDMCIGISDHGCDYLLSVQRDGEAGRLRMELFRACTS